MGDYLVREQYLSKIRAGRDDTGVIKVKPLLRPKDNYAKTILTLDRFGLGNENGILIRNVLDWLME